MCPTMDVKTFKKNSGRRCTKKPHIFVAFQFSTIKKLKVKIPAEW